MKVCVFTGIFPPDIGGPAGYVQRLAQDFAKKGIGVAVLAYADKGGKEKKEAFNICRISRRYPKIIRHLFYCFNGLSVARDADVVYAQNLFSVGIPGILVSRILGKKIVIKVVGDYVWEQAITRFNVKDNIDDFQAKKYSFFIETLKKVQSWLARRADSIIVPSIYLRGIVKGWGVAESKITVIYNVPALLPVADLSKQDAKEMIGIFGNIILSIGRLSPWKGFKALIEVLPKLLEQNPEFKLVIAGDGEQKPVLESLIKTLGLQGKVFLVGKVAHEKIPLYFKAADLFLLNSRHEGLSHTILEAMVSGIPIIVSNRGGNPELIQDGYNGFLVQYNNKKDIIDAVLRIWKNNGKSKEFIENSGKKLENFKWSRLLEETITVLKEHS